jgi:hypothetical protein
MVSFLVFRNNSVCQAKLLRVKLNDREIRWVIQEKLNGTESELQHGMYVQYREHFNNLFLEPIACDSNSPAVSSQEGTIRIDTKFHYAAKGAC